MRIITTGFVFLAVGLAVAAQTVATQSVAAQTPATGAPTTAAAANDTKISGARTILYLRTDLTSKNMAIGKQIKAESKQAITLSDGEMIPKGTQFLGSILAVSKHSKDKPNGAVLVEFNRALPKGKEPINVVVRLIKLAPSVGSENSRTTLPNSNGGMVGMAANSGGGALISSQVNDRSNLKDKYVEGSSVDGVYLSGSDQGSGLLFALKDDVYVNADVQMTALIAPAAAAK